VPSQLTHELIDFTVTPGFAGGVGVVGGVGVAGGAGVGVGEPTPTGAPVVGPLETEEVDEEEVDEVAELDEPPDVSQPVTARATMKSARRCRRGSQLIAFIKWETTIDICRKAADIGRGGDYRRTLRAINCGRSATHTSEPLVFQSSLSIRARATLRGIAEFVTDSRVSCVPEEVCAIVPL
jgi:hypothetical protein